MVAMLLVTLFASAALVAVGAMIHSALKYGPRFADLRRELRDAHLPAQIRCSWRDTSARKTAVIYNLDFKAKADGLPFHPELKPELLAAA